MREFFYDFGGCLLLISAIFCVIVLVIGTLEYFHLDKKIGNWVLKMCEEVEENEDNSKC